jgi:transcription-repair coupling factor (superfamily II helicase)
MADAAKAMVLQKSLAAEGVRAVYAANPAALTGGTVVVTAGALAAGFELPHAGLAAVTELDIFGRRKKRRLPRVAKDKQIAYFRDINIGDYVVLSTTASASTPGWRRGGRRRAQGLFPGALRGRG